MKKYFYAAKSSFLNELAYPARFFGLFIADSFPILLFFFLWSTIFSQQANIKGYTLTTLVTYYAVSRSINLLTNSKTIARSIGSNVNTGDLSDYLVRPINFNIYQFFSVLVRKITQSVLPITLLVVLINNYQSLFLRPQNPTLFLVSLTLSILITHLVFSIIGTIAFWTVKTWGIFSIFHRVIQVLNGSLFPLDFLPEKILQVADLLPFKYMTYFPISVYLGSIEKSQIPFQILIQVIWIFLLFFLYKGFWAKGLIKYDSVGK